jgi:hypothetical protein
MSVSISRLLIVAFAVMTVLCVVGIRPVSALNLSNPVTNIACTVPVDEDGNPLPDEWVPDEDTSGGGSAIAP